VVQQDFSSEKLGTQ